LPFGPRLFDERFSSMRLEYRLVGAD